MIKANDLYPKSVVCRKDFRVEIRLLEIADIPKHVEMLKTLDEHDRANLPHDVMDPNYPKKIARQIEDDLAHRLVAWHEGDEIVASLALYRGTSVWMRHTGDVVLVTHPKYRRYGIATVLFDEMIPLAQMLKIEKIYAQLTKKHTEAINMVKVIGFRREAILKDHIKDKYGRYRDLRIYSMDLEAAHRAMEELMTQFISYSG